MIDRREAALVASLSAAFPTMTVPLLAEIVEFVRQWEPEGGWAPADGDCRYCGGVGCHRCSAAALSPQDAPTRAALHATWEDGERVVVVDGRGHEYAILIDTNAPEGIEGPAPLLFPEGTKLRIIPAHSGQCAVTYADSAAASVVSPTPTPAPEGMTAEKLCEIADTLWRFACYAPDGRHDLEPPASRQLRVWASALDSSQETHPAPEDA